MSGRFGPQLRAVRHGLLELHKALLDAERARYEQVHGKVTPGRMLQLAFQDPQFAWLRSMSTLIVRIDELLEGRDAATREDRGAGEAEELLASARTLLSLGDVTTGFAREYAEALQRDPQIAILHGRVIDALGAGGGIPPGGQN